MTIWKTGDESGGRRLPGGFSQVSEFARLDADTVRALVDIAGGWAMTDTTIPVSPRRAARLLWRAWAIAYIALAALTMLMYARSAFLEPSNYGGAASASLGADLIRTTDPGRIDVVVRGLKAGTPLARAGVHEGDRLRLDIRWNDFRVLATGETFGFTRVAPGKPTHITLVAPRYRGRANTVGEYRFLITLLDFGVGVLLFLRGRGDLGVETLGMAFVAVAITSNFPSSPDWSIFWQLLAYAGTAFAPFLILTFAMSFYGRNTRLISSLEKYGLATLLVGLVVAFFTRFFCDYFAYTALWVRAITALILLEVVVANLASIAYFLRGYFSAAGAAKSKYALLLIALLLTFCLTAVQTYSFLVLKLARMDPDNPLYDLNVFLSLVGPLLFAYAVLAHKVVDIGFALNRTLVYGAVSVVMLSVFTLIKWAVGHTLIPQHQVSAAFNAGSAVLLTLSFKRIFDFVEGNVEALFFRTWRDNDKQLEQFAARADVLTSLGDLKAAWVGELQRFSGGADVGLYIADGDGGYRAYGEPAPFPHAIDSVEPALDALRNAKGANELQDAASRLGAALALPRRRRGVLLGFVLMSNKPHKGLYRSDEVAALSSAAQKVGSDLYALRVDQLERDYARLAEKVRRLENESHGGNGPKLAWTNPSQS